jgi:ribonuclease E
VLDNDDTTTENTTDNAPVIPPGDTPDAADAPPAAKKATAKKSAAKKTAAKKTTAKKATAKKTAAKKSADAPETDTAAAEDATDKPKKKAAAKKKSAAKKSATSQADASASAEDTTAEREASGSAAPAVLFKAPEKQAAPARKRAVRKPGQQPGQQASEQVTEQASEQSGELPERPARKAKDTSEGKPDETAGADGADGSDAGDDDSSEGGNRRRRRRGGRRRRKPSDGPGGDSSGDDSGDDDSDSESDDSETDNDRDEGQGQGQGGSRRRRRRRRPGEDDDSGPDDSAKTTTRARKPRNPEDEITSIGGSTRLEAKKQRRREGREAGRRRAPIVSEAEFLARRESVERVMVIRQRDDLTQIGVLEDKVLVEHYVARESQTSLIGNVYLGRVQNVLPSMEAAFIDIGKGRNAVLYAGEVNWSALGHKDGQPRKIESVLSSGQAILVQVSKDPVGHKGARLTGQISLPGRFLVYVPEGNTSGISRKLPDTERNRLKTLLKEIVPDTAGVIVRTAAEGASEDELTRDVERLTARWSDIEEKVKNGKSPQLLYGEPDLTLKVVRDLFTEDFGKLVVQGDDAWDVVDNYVKHVAPDLSERLERFEPAEDGPDAGKDLFASYRVDEQIAKGLDRKVWLPSGGSLVIDRTEAMTVVDVNTGKFTGSGGNLEETVTKNNLEAAEEIVRQLRLRDIGGIIVVDFIDMVLESNRDLVLRRLVECLGRDRTRHQVAEVTSLGLVQMTRKRIGTGLLEAFSTECEHCKGRGIVLHDHPVDSNGNSDDDEPRGRRTRGGGRNRGRSGSGSGDGEGRKNGNGGNGNGNGRPPTPADLAGSRPPEKQADGSYADPDDESFDPDDTGVADTQPDDTQDNDTQPEGTASEVAESSQETPAEPAEVPEAEPAAEQNVIGRPTETQSEPVEVPSESGSAEPEPATEVPTTPSAEAPTEPEGPRVVTSTRRRGARRAAGPPPASTEITIPGAGTQAGPASEPADIPVDPAVSDSEDAGEDGETNGFSVLHVPVKRKGARKR